MVRVLMETSEIELTPEQKMDCVIYQIRDYARRESLNAAQVKQLFDVGIVARGVLSLAGASSTAGSVRDLTPDEMAAVDIETVAKNNSASLEELMKNRTST